MVQQSDSRRGGDESAPTVDAVLFDLHNTTLDGDYAAVGIAHVGNLMARRWAIEPDDVGPAFGRGVHTAMRSYIDRDFYLMHDVFLDAFRHVADELGIAADDDELAELDREMWRANIPAARPANGAIETMRALRDLGIKVGIVSWADTDVFDGLIEQLGFADHVDVALCSEDVRSCKPHPGIFRAALEALGTTPDRAIFVGDSIDGDIVGGNRLGMITALVAAGEYSSDIDAFGDDPVTVPDHRLTSLPDIVDVVLARQRTGH